MATQTLEIQAQYGQGNAYNAFTTSSGNNGDYNRFYIGGSSTRGRTRFKVTIPSSLVGTPTRIVIGMITDEDNCTPGRMRAYLSTMANVDSDVDHWIDYGAILQTSYWYTDQACTSRASTYMSSPAFIFCSFTYTFSKGGTYYVGVFPYSSDSSAQTNTNYSDVWFRGRNMPGYLTAYVEYTLPTYTVSYNANGGTGAPGAQTKTHGTDLTLSSTEPTKETQSSTFTITGNGNGGTSKKVTATKTVTYSFQGWATSASGSVVYQPGGAYSANAGATLYAVWAESVSYSNNTLAALGATERANSSAGVYTVTLDANGGFCATEAVQAARTTSYTFLGWGSSSSAGSSLPSSTAFSSDTTVYALWSGHTTTAPVTLPVPERAGYTFLGWAVTAAAESGVTGTYTPPKSITLFAIWEANGLLHVFTASRWADGIVWVFAAGKWWRGIPWVYNGSRWKMGG